MDDEVDKEFEEWGYIVVWYWLRLDHVALVLGQNHICHMPGGPMIDLCDLVITQICYSKY